VEHLEELLLDTDRCIPEDVTKYSYMCVCSLSDIDIEDWLMTLQAMLDFRGTLPEKMRQCPAIFKNKQHH